MDEALRMRWPEVRELTGEEAAAVFDAFVDRCVLPDFAAKLRREYGKRRRVGARFFRRATPAPQGEALARELGFGAAAVNVDVVFGPPSDLFGYFLVGPLRPWRDMFVDRDAIAIARVRGAGRTAWLYYESDREVCYVCDHPLSP